MSYRLFAAKPGCFSKLQEEISSANLSPLPQWKETYNLPHLGAAIKGAIRIHSPVGLLLERDSLRKRQTNVHREEHQPT